MRICEFQDLGPGRWEFKSQLCHVPGGSYLTSLNFDLVLLAK